MSGVRTSLVTGGAGFIGAHLVRELLDLGHRVVVLDDLSGGFRDNLDRRARFVEGSVTDVAQVERLFADDRFDYVYHLAAYAAEGLSHFVRRFNYTNNLIGSINLVNQSVLQGVRRFVFTSSIAVYGSGPLPLRESQLPRPEDPYGIAKLAVEQDLHAAQAMFGLDYTVFRPHNVYGEFQNLGDRYRNVVGIFMNQVMADRPLSVFGDGEQTRAFSYVGDVVPAMARCVEVPESRNEVFNVGGDQVYSVNQLAQAVLDLAGSAREIVHLPARNEVTHAYSDHAKFRGVFGDLPSTALREGLQRMWHWAQQAGVRRTKPFEAIEIERNLPEVWKRG